MSELPNERQSARTVRESEAAEKQQESLGTVAVSRLVRCSSFIDVGVSTKLGKKTFKELLLSQTQELDRDRFCYGWAKELGVTDREVSQVSLHSNCLTTCDTLKCVHAIYKKVIVGAGLKIKDAFGVTIRVLKEIADIRHDTEPLPEHALLEPARVEHHSSLTNQRSEGVQYVESRAREGVDGHRIAVMKPKLDSGVNLTAGSVNFGDCHCGVSNSSNERPEHAPSPAGASVDPSPTSEPTETSENKAAGDGCRVSSCSDLPFSEMLNSELEWTLQRINHPTLGWVTTFNIVDGSSSLSSVTVEDALRMGHDWYKSSCL